MSITDIRAEAVTDSRLEISAKRTVRVLETLAQSMRALTIDELREATGYPASDVAAVVRTLLALGWLESLDGGASVHIGPHTLLCGTAYLDRDPILPDAIRTLEVIRELTGYTTHFVRRDGTRVLYLASRATDSPPIAPMRVGRALPAHTTAAGIALLAGHTVAQLHEMFPDEVLMARTRRTIVNRDQLFADIERAQRIGYGIEREQNTAGLCCAAAAVPHRIPATDAISCEIPIESATEDELARIGQLLVTEAASLGVRLRKQGIK